MQQKIPILVILLLCAAIGFAGCTGTTSTPAQTAAPAATQAAAAPATNNLVVSPTDVVPDNNQVLLSRKKNMMQRFPLFLMVVRASIW